MKLALRTGNRAKTDRPLGVMVLTILELFIGILGIPTGDIMLMDPTGRTLGLDILLDYIPMHDFTLVGAWLLSAFGVLPILIALGLWTRKRLAWTTALVLAVVELIWIAGQILLLYRAGFSVWQGIIAAIALATIYFLYRPTVKAYFNK